MKNDTIIDCQKVCNVDTFFVCGTDGRTYSSQCELKKAACRNDLIITVDYEGKCKGL